MSILLIALAAVSAHPVTPSERAIIEAAVKPELPAPGVLKIGTIPAEADVVCGRVNGLVFRANITRNSAGRITAADQATVLTPADPAVVRMVVNQVCTAQGYDVF